MSNNITNLPIPIPKTQTDVTASRTAGTVYRNLNGNPIFYNITVASTVAGANVVGVYSDALANPVLFIAGYQEDATIAGGISTISFWVLPGNYYKVVVLGGTATLTWIMWS